MYRARDVGCPVVGTMVSELTKPRSILSFEPAGKGEGERTWWDFELWGKLDRLGILDYATRICVEKEALEVDDEYSWKCFDEHRNLLARFSRVRWLDLHESWL